MPPVNSKSEKNKENEVTPFSFKGQALQRQSRKILNNMVQRLREEKLLGHLHIPVNLPMDRAELYTNVSTILHLFPISFYNYSTLLSYFRKLYFINTQYNRDICSSLYIYTHTECRSVFIGKYLIFYTGTVCNV